MESKNYGEIILLDFAYCIDEIIKYRCLKNYKVSIQFVELTRKSAKKCISDVCRWKKKHRSEKVNRIHLRVLLALYTIFNETEIANREGKRKEDIINNVQFNIEEILRMLVE